MLPDTGHWNPSLTALSVAVSILTALVALRVLETAREAPTAQACRRWLAVTALVFGGGIWSKYVVGLLAFHPGVPAQYAVAPMVEASVLSVLFAGVGFAGVGVVRGVWLRGAAAVFMMFGILAVLRLDMAAVHLVSAPPLDLQPFAYAALVAAGIAAVVAWLTARPQPLAVSILGAVAIGAGVCCTHWLGMKAVGLQGPLLFHAESQYLPPDMVASGLLAALVAVFVLTLLGVVLAAAAVDRRVSARLRESDETLEARVRERTMELERNTVALSRARDDAVRTAKSKNHMLANMSHELRTPLNAILGFSEMMRGELQGPLENAYYKRYASLIHGSGTHLLGLVNQLLDQSKLEADRVELTAEQVDIGELTDE